MGREKSTNDTKNDTKLHTGDLGDAGRVVKGRTLTEPGRGTGWRNVGKAWGIGTAVDGGQESRWKVA